MKKLTNGQRFALAREARRLAMECVEGTAPEFGVGRFGTMGLPVCAIGHVRSRARVRDIGELYFEHFDVVFVVEEANDEPDDTAGRHAALPFPLLALADALEASAASVPQAPPEVP